MSSHERKTGEPPRQSLRIPGGWVVEYNELRQAEPSALAGDAVLRSYLSQDLLQLRHPRRDLLIDVGWSPDGDPTGEYRMILIQGNGWDSPLRSFRTPHLDELVSQLEEWLIQVLV